MECVATFGTEGTSGHLHVLFVEYLGDVGWCETIAGHLQWVEPDTHGIVGSHDVYLTHTGNTTQAWLDVDFRIVGQKGAVECTVRAIDSHLFDVRGLALTHSDTAFYYVAGQSALYSGSAVLYVDHRHIRIGALTEENTDGGGTVVRS